MSYMLTIQEPAERKNLSILMIRMLISMFEQMDIDEEKAILAELDGNPEKAVGEAIYKSLNLFYTDEPEQPEAA